MSFGDLRARCARHAAARSGGRCRLAIVVVETRRHARVVIVAGNVSANDQAIAQRAARVLAGALVVDSADGAVLASGDVAAERRSGKRKCRQEHPS
jgi:hypothetical protein